MTNLPPEFDGQRRVVVLSVLTARAQALAYAPIQDDDTHWFPASAEDLKRLLLEWQVPVSVMDAQDKKYMEDA